MKKIFLSILLAVFLLSAAGMSYSQTAMGTTYQTTLTLADTEYSVSLGRGVKGFSIQCQSANDVRVSFASGGTVSSYWTIKSGGIYYSPSITTSSVVYLRCFSAAGVVVEIEYWK